MLAAATLMASAALGAAEASALERSWTDAKYDRFAGDGCGSVSSVTEHLRRGAHRIRVVSPSPGRVLEDPSTGWPVARVTTAHVEREADGGRLVRFTAQGTDDACTNPDQYPFGWETDPVRFAVRYQTRERLYFPSRCYNAAYKPRSVIVTCADANYRLRGLRWRRWNGPVARGRGFVYVNDCIPFCAAGRFHYHPVVVRLTKPRLTSCNGVRRFMYRHLHVRYVGSAPAGPKRLSLNFKCMGA